ncbi:MAG: serine O-acetyltransferase [Erysipelotrichaceae bacterium]
MKYCTHQQLKQLIKLSQSWLFEDHFYHEYQDVEIRLLKHIQTILSYSIKDEEILLQTSSQLLDEITELKQPLLLDAAAAFEGDPACTGIDEVIIAYPGWYTVFIHRLAHLFYLKYIPLIPRMLSEYAHSNTGIDIHPGARIGSHFFIDHGTGVVIGETVIIGNHVKIYQGVTLGALSTDGGQALKNVKRHPTIEDHVTIYANATILGGTTIIGEHSIIGGNCFIYESIDAYSKVMHHCPIKLK